MPERHSDRERREAYFLIILLATRPFLFVGGVILLSYGIAASLAYPAVSLVALLMALYIFSLVFSDWVALQTARLGAWLAAF
jgi:hypothetical protein